MTKAKTNALDALRALIAERQQYEQWLATLETKRESTADHVFERVHGDYRSRLERVIADMRGHSEELQLSITALSSRLVEVARDEDLRRDALQEAELRAVVGEYEPAQWEEMRVEAERELEKTAGDRESLDNQLAELRGIQKLSEVGASGAASSASSASDSDQMRAESGRAPGMGTSETAGGGGGAAQGSTPRSAGNGLATPSTEARALADDSAVETLTTSSPSASDAGMRGAPPRRDLGRSATPSEERSSEAGSSSFRADAAQAVSPASSSRSSSAPTPSPATSARENASSMSTVGTDDGPRGSRAAKGKASQVAPAPVAAPTGGKAAKAADSRAEQAKTLKCPECGTPNYPTEWYCERCGGELATM